MTHFTSKTPGKNIFISCGKFYSDIVKSSYFIPVFSMLEIDILSHTLIKPL